MPTMPTRASYQRGDVLLVKFPNSDLRTAKMRPALIVQADDLNTGLKQVVLAMVSSNLQRANHKSRALIETKTEAGKKTGLLFDSVVIIYE